MPSRIDFARSMNSFSMLLNAPCRFYVRRVMWFRTMTTAMNTKASNRISIGPTPNILAAFRSYLPKSSPCFRGVIIGWARRGGEGRLWLGWGRV